MDEINKKEILDTLIAQLTKTRTLDIKTIPDKILDLMYFDTNGPSNTLSTVSVYYYLNYCEKKKGDFSQTQIPLKKLLKITRNIGFLCQVERMRRKNIIDYSIDMDKIFDPDTNISITRKPAMGSSTEKLS